MKSVEKMENVLLNSYFCDCMKKFLNIVCNEDLNEIKNFQKEIEKKYQELDNSFNCKEITKRAEGIQNNLNNFDKDIQKEKDNSIINTK